MTIYMCVEGGKKHQKELTEQVVYAVIKKLMPRLKNLEIDIKLDPRLSEKTGCVLRDFVTTIVHEMVHVKQGVRGELRELMGKQYWKGRVCNKEYMEQPWEKEAYRLQDKLATWVWENVL
jgi:hypothetical protein